MTARERERERERERGESQVRQCAGRQSLVGPSQAAAAPVTRPTLHTDQLATQSVPPRTATIVTGAGQAGAGQGGRGGA